MSRTAHDRIKRYTSAFRCIYENPTSRIYTLSLHDALPIYRLEAFYDNPNALRDYFRDIGRMVLAANITKIVTQRDRKSGSAGMPRPISYAVFCLKKKKTKPSSPVR